MAGIRTKFLTGHIFTEDDEVGIGQGVWDHYHPIFHRFGVGSGAVQPRYYPGIDTKGNLFMDPKSLIKSQDLSLEDHGFGWDGQDFVVKCKGTVLFRINSLGSQFSGPISQTNAKPNELTGGNVSGLTNLIFPLFSNKTLHLQFNKTAYAAMDQSNAPKVYFNAINFLTDFQSTFTRGGSADVGYVRYVGNSGNYLLASSNQPRITFSHSSKKCLGMLIEPTSTNLLIQSSGLNNWTAKNLTLTQEINSDWTLKGLNNPFSFIETAVNDEHSITETFTSDIAKPISSSFYFYAKSFSGSRALTALISDATKSNVFGIVINAASSGAPTISSNTVTGNSIILNSNVESIGNNIYRISFTGTLNTSDNTGNKTLNYTIASLGSTPGNTNIIFTPGTNTGNWCLIGDAQAEQSYFPTSYIQTGTTTLTRTYDELKLKLSAFKYGPSEGIFELGFRVNQNTVLGTVLFSLQNDDKTNRTEYYISVIDKNSNSLTIGSRVYTGNSLVSDTTSFMSTRIINGRLTISYTNISSSYTYAVISGSSGLSGAISFINYE